MKRPKFFIVSAFCIFFLSVILVAFATNESKIFLEPSNVEDLVNQSHHQKFEPPENVTVIPDLEIIPISLTLKARSVIVPIGASINTTVTICSSKDTDLLLAIGSDNHTDDFILIGSPSTLPDGISISLNQTRVSLKAASPVTINLEVSIESNATHNVYTLQIFAIRRTSHGSHSVSVPFQIIIP